MPTIDDFDGAWRAVYAETLWGEGLVVLRAGKLLGCDPQYFYEGVFSVADDGQVSATIHVKHFAGMQRSIFQRGLSVSLMEYSAELRGQLTGNMNELRLTGTVTNADYGFGIVLMRLFPIPSV